MSDIPRPVISTTQQWHIVTGTLDEAFTVAREKIALVDAWAGASVSMNPVMRDHKTGTFMWEVMISGMPLRTDSNQHVVPGQPPVEQ